PKEIVGVDGLIPKPTLAKKNRGKAATVATQAIAINAFAFLGESGRWAFPFIAKSYFSVLSCSTSGAILLCISDLARMPNSPVLSLKKTLAGKLNRSTPFERKKVRRRQALVSFQNGP